MIEVESVDLAGWPFPVPGLITDLVVSMDDRFLYFANWLHGGGPNMLHLSLDGRRLYVTNSLYSSWDNQFYSELRSWLLEIDIGEDGGMAVDPGFFVDFHDRPDGAARAHEVRFPGGDSTSEVFP